MALVVTFDDTVPTLGNAPGSIDVGSGLNGPDQAAPIPPIVAAATLEIYDQMAGHADGDPAAGWPLLRLLDGPGRLLEALDQLTAWQQYSGAFTPGWSQLLDIARCPTAALPWLGQFVGVVVDTARTDAEQRAQIRAEQGFQRGTPAAIIASVAATVPAGTTVTLAERLGGDPYSYMVHVWTSSVPNPAATQAAFDRTRPAGLIHSVLRIATTPTWAELDVLAHSWTALGALFSSWTAMDNYTP